MFPADSGTPTALQDLMGRVGATVPACQFVDAVIYAFRYVEPVPDAVVHARFHGSRARGDFRDLLRQAVLPERARTLCIGCGPLLGGRNSVYASATVREVYPWAEPELFDLGRRTWDLEDGMYDCVVSHSLLHFIYDPIPVCGAIHRLVKPGGVYIMANEPNARFWSNAECAGELCRVEEWESRRRRWRRLADPGRYWSRLVRSVRPASRPGTVAGINAFLRERLGLDADLTVKEIVRIVDPHQPDSNPGEFAYGSAGLDWTPLAAGSGLEAVRTSGYVVRDNPARVPQRWRAVDEGLSVRFPMDGFTFSALWRR
jgi:SAM-dependent methyltransferase